MAEGGERNRKRFTHKLPSIVLADVIGSSGGGAPSPPPPPPPPGRPRQKASIDVRETLPRNSIAGSRISLFYLPLTQTHRESNIARRLSCNPNQNLPRIVRIKLTRETGPVRRKPGPVMMMNHRRGQ
ncbi:hypothetical protein LY78DRAFT_356284 [Colletotrichum sublineola]|nr:hypothetical protein LY78DRAFT_356284 [Colletotrichum sublineola]